MIEKITDQNLERYDSRLKEWCDRKFFEKGNYGKYQTTEEAGAVAFYSAPNTLLEGKVKFSFKETPPASGDKSPTNPSTITGVSQLHVFHANSNMLAASYYDRDKVSQEGVTYQLNADGSITLSGKNTTADRYYRFDYYTFPLHTGIDYYNTSHNTATSLGTVPSCMRIYNDVINSGKNNIEPDSSWSPSISAKHVISLKITKNADYSTGVTVYPSFSLMPLNGFYEKSETVDYTISLGSTYYGGEIDLATGVMTVTVGFAELTTFGGVDGIGTDTILFGADHVISHPNGGGGYENSCQELSRVNALSDDLEGYNFWGGAGRETVRVRIAKSRLDVSGAVDSSNPTAAEWLTAGNAWLSQHSLHFVSALATPYTVQLSPTQILSLSQFDKYTPRLNTVYTDADSVQISYLKSPIRDEYEKTQAILSLGGNS